ncbi:MAG TPA: Flp family type IVb pilin [Candidatus Bathyarchaeia archaeon]|nr:Flp family type IVb pilin [Candidatus Bathyarchaeia archaeon]
MEIMKKLLVEEEGQGMVEYGLIIGLIAIVLIGALTALNGGLTTIFTRITTALNGTNSGQSGTTGQ